jgi:hypothetical protein
MEKGRSIIKIQQYLHKHAKATASIPQDSFAKNFILI